MIKQAIAFLFYFSCSFTSNEQTDDGYTEEIMQHIVDPCFAYSAGKSEPVAQMSESEMVTLMKIMSSGAVQDTLDVTLPVVKGKPLEARMQVYELGLKLCIRGTGK